jgi:hypothetical protein
LVKKAVLILPILFCAQIGFADHHYTTSFPLTENHISEHGNWINGGVTGLDWGNIQTINGPGAASGTAAEGYPEYSDSTAVLTGTWPANQQACGVLYLNSSLNRNMSPYEVEIRLNTSISAHSITGYEFDYSLRNDGRQDMGIVRWNGALGNFTSLSYAPSPPAISNGDVLCATSIDGTLSMYVNGSQIVHTTDLTYRGGSPGIGINQVDTGNFQYYGFSLFTASSAAARPHPGRPDSTRRDPRVMTFLLFGVAVGSIVGAALSSILIPRYRRKKESG